MDSRKRIITKGDCFSFIFVCGLWAYYRTSIVAYVDKELLNTFGKSLSGRNIALQVLVYGVLFLISAFIPILLNHLMQKNAKYNRLTDTVILLILAVPAAQMAIICANQVLRRDDYWEIADARTYGFPGSIFFEMKRFNGRYTGWGLRSLHAVLADIPYIDIFLLLNLILLILGTSMLAYRLLQFISENQSYSGMRIQAFMLGFGASLAIILNSTNIWEFWFWGSGTMIYGFGLSMCILSLALIFRTADGPRRTMILPAITCFLTCGCSELCTASLAAFLLVILIWKRIRNNYWDRKVLFFLAEVVLLCTAVFLLSGSLKYAGNMAHVDGSGQSWFSSITVRIPSIIGWAFDALTGYTFSRPKELAVFLFAAFLTGTQLHFNKKNCISFLIAATMLALLAQCVLMINSTLDYMPPRVVTIGTCWLFFAMAALCMLLGSFIQRNGKSHANRIIMLFCSLLFCLAFNRFYTQNIDQARDVRISWMIRNTLLLQHENEDETIMTCSIPSPGSYRGDISADPMDEFNIGTALFYRIPAISAETACPPWGEAFLPEDIYRDWE